MPVDKTLISRLSAEWALRSFQQQKNSATLGVLPTRTVTWKPSAASRVRVDEILQRAWKKSTSGKYASAVDDFVRFCTAHSVPLSEALPASEPLLCAYASTFAGVLAGGTVRGKMSALRSWHIQNGLPWHSSLQLKYIIRGIENMRPVESIRPPRPPVSIQMIESLSQTLSSTDPFDVCVLALATTCFWGQIRLGEILPNREIGYDAALFPRWSDLKVPNARGSRVLHLPSTKTGGTFGEDVMITRQLSPFDPIAALEAHAVINHLNGSTSLASYVSSAGVRTGLTKRKFLRRINCVLDGGGFPFISGHCFRIGGTTQLLLAGVPPDIVKLLGRWTSDAFLRYWRSLEIIGPLYVELLASVMSHLGSTQPLA